MAKKTVDPIFAEYAASAPVLDLGFYLDYISRHDAEYGPTTIAIIEQMIALYVDLQGPKPGSVASQKRHVWTLIDRFKASIPKWYGNAGSTESREKYDAECERLAAEALQGVADVQPDEVDETDATIDGSETVVSEGM